MHLKFYRGGSDIFSWVSYLFSGWYSGFAGLFVVKAKGVPKAGLPM
jgi:hypothetical protein